LPSGKDLRQILRDVQFFGLFSETPAGLKNCFRVWAFRGRDVTHPSSLLIVMALFGLMVVEIATRLHASA
jgi:hypothetical protein